MERVPAQQLSSDGAPYIYAIGTDDVVVGRKKLVEMLVAVPAARWTVRPTAGAAALYVGINLFFGLIYQTYLGNNF